MAVKDSVCTVAGCGRPQYSGALCAGHHMQHKRGEEFRELRKYRIDGPHTCTVHAPGTTGCYHTHSCRCRECRVANGVARKRRVAKRVVYVDAARSRSLLRELAGMGWLTSEVAAATGLNPRHMEHLRRGTQPRVKPETARRVIAAHRRLSSLPLPRDNARSRRWIATYARRMGWAPSLVPGVGTNRRLQALSALGWLDGEIGKVMGVPTWRVCHLRHATEVAVADAAAVVATYDRLSMRLPPGDRPHRQRRTRATGLRWSPPLAWDDEDIDNPDATPVVVIASTSTRVRAHVEDLVWMALSGARMEEAAKRAGLTPGGVESALLRASRGDLISKMKGVAA